jgi:acyl carrier protein
MNPADKIRNFIQTLLTRRRDKRPFNDDSSLILSGRLSSVDAVEIAVFLEENFGVDFAEIGFDQAKIDTVDLILSLAGQTKSS